MLEEFCRDEIYNRCKEHIPPKRLVYLKWEKEEQKNKFDGFLQWSDRFTVYDSGIAKKLAKQPIRSPLRQAVGLFSREGAYICDHMINAYYHNDWEEAMEHYGTFNEMFNGFKEYYAMRKESFMSKTKSLIQEQTGALPKICKTPNSHGGVANLLKVLTKTMHEQGSTIRTIAKVQYAVCTQAGIYIPDEFITDVLVAMDIEPNLAMSYEEHQEREKERLKNEGKNQK